MKPFQNFNYLSFKQFNFNLNPLNIYLIFDFKE